MDDLAAILAAGDAGDLQCDAPSNRPNISLFGTFIAAYLGFQSFYRVHILAYLIL